MANRLATHAIYATEALRKGQNDRGRIHFSVIVMKRRIAMGTKQASATKSPSIVLMDPGLSISS